MTLIRPVAMNLSVDELMAAADPRSCIDLESAVRSRRRPRRNVRVVVGVDVLMIELIDGAD